jgi:hypothetical protein
VAQARSCVPRSPLVEIELLGKVTPARGLGWGVVEQLVVAPPAHTALQISIIALISLLQSRILFSLSLPSSTPTLLQQLTTHCNFAEPFSCHSFSSYHYLHRLAVQLALLHSPQSNTERDFVPNTYQHASAQEQQHQAPAGIANRSATHRTNQPLQIAIHSYRVANTIPHDFRQALAVNRLHTTT